MKLLILLSGIVLLFTSCSDKSNAFDFFKFDKNYEKAISYTKTSSLMKSMETEAVISTVYLNKVLPDEYNQKESFFVALYINSDKIFYDKYLQKQPNYTLTLNGQKAINISELRKDSKLRLLLPIKNDWNEYYLVEFEKTDKDNLELNIVESEDALERLLPYLQENPKPCRQKFSESWLSGQQLQRSQHQEPRGRETHEPACRFSHPALTDNRQYQDCGRGCVSAVTSCCDQWPPNWNSP